MSGNPTGSADASDPAAAVNENTSAPANAVGADKWAKAVVDGVPPESNAADSAAGDASDASDAQDGGGEDTANGDSPSTDDIPSNDDDVIDAEIVEGDATAEGKATDEQPSADEETLAGDISVEDLVIDLERVTTERDQYLDASRRLQAEFENYKKQVLKREADARERANDSLVGELLPVLDAFDGALANGAEDVAPMRTSFLDAMAKQGLERIDPTDVPFDPTLHDAVMHEDASDVDGPVVAEVMRAGYVWKGRVLRPAMVRTRG